MAEQQQNTTQRLHLMQLIAGALTVAVVGLSIAFWHTMMRVDVVEAQLAKLSDTLERRVPEGSWRTRLMQSSPVQAPVQENVHTAMSAKTSGEANSIQDRELFNRAVQTLYRSLDLSDERKREIGTGLEDVLKSIWPEYVQIYKSPNADTAALQHTFCGKAATILTDQEAAKLGC